MMDVTVKQLAEVVGIPIDKLLVQLGEAGIEVSAAEDVISEDQKMQLLTHLRRAHGKDDKAAPTEPKKITLRRKSVSEIRHTNAQGRVKTVNVEVRKKRTYVKRTVVLDEEQPPVETDLPESAPVEAPSAAQPEAPQAEAPAVDSGEADAAEQERQRLEQEATAAAEAHAREVEQAAAEAADQARRQAEEAARLAEEEAHRVLAAEAAKATAAATQEAAQEQAGAAPETVGADGKPAPAAAAKDKPKKGKRDRLEAEGEAVFERKLAQTRYGREELHVTAAKSRRKKKTGKPAPVSAGGGKHAFEMPTGPIVREVVLPESITVAELAQKMSIKATELIKVMMKMGTMVTINQVIDQDTAAIVVEELGHKPKILNESAIEDEMLETADEGEAKPRPPVVTIMGHVDHGKTSLLDHIRATRVAAGEAGGITQHIGAYHVETEKGVITFLDTPGHAAFTAMRARGAEVTDIVILVVAADDGVMPQTKEAIQHARAAGVPIVVAVNKVDKEDADPERVKQELTQHEVIPEAWGGDTQFVNVSAKTGEGIDQLLDALLLQAEVMELKAVDEGRARGVVVESSLDKGRGPVATVLVQSGVLNRGDILLSGTEFGRVRAMFDESGKPIDSAGPSMPAVVLGLSGTPNAGDEAMVVPDERKAREVAMFRQGKFREVKLARQQAAKLEQMFTQMEEGKSSSLNLVIKADVQGSAEALSDALTNLSNDEVKVKIVSSGVGGLNEGDVNLAVASNAVMIGFNVRADAVARRLIQENEVDLHYYSVIYDVIDEVKKAISGMLAPEIREEIVGLAEVRDVFRSPKIGAIAGCVVIEGTVKRNNPIRVLRDNVVIYEGELESLRRFKDDVSEVRAGIECGIGVRNYNDVKVGDHIEVYEQIKVARTL